MNFSHLRTYEVVTLCDNMTLGYCFNTCRGWWEERLAQKYTKGEWSSVLITLSFYCCVYMCVCNHVHTLPDSGLWRTLHLKIAGKYVDFHKNCEYNEKHCEYFFNIFTQSGHKMSSLPIKKCIKMLSKREHNCLRGVYLHAISVLLNAICCFEQLLEVRGHICHQKSPANTNLKCSTMCCNRMLISPNTSSVFAKTLPHLQPVCLNGTFLGHVLKGICVGQRQWKVG